MTGNLYRGQAGLPFSSTLRVYEPLEAFPAGQQEALRTAGARAESRAAVENAELLASLGRITRPGGDPFPTGQTDLVAAMGGSNGSGGCRPPGLRIDQIFGSGTTFSHFTYYSDREVSRTTDHHVPYVDAVIR